LSRHQSFGVFFQLAPTAPAGTTNAQYRVADNGTPSEQAFSD
jgi:hypothetical protein